MIDDIEVGINQIRILEKYTLFKGQELKFDEIIGQIPKNFQVIEVFFQF